MRSIKFISALAAFFLLLTHVAIAAAPADEAADFVKDLATKVLAIFNDPHLSAAQREDRLYPIALQFFDVPRIARFTLGRFWNDTPAQQRNDFTDAFQHYIVRVYAGQFELHHDVDFQVVNARPEDPTRTFVRTRLLRHDGGPPITLDWRVSKRTGSNKIVDVSVEGVSQLLTLRDQFVSVIQSHGNSVAALTQELRARNAAARAAG